MCEQLQVTSGELRSWHELIPPSGSAMHPDREREEPQYQVSQEEMRRYESYANILGTGMSVEQVKELEARDRKAVAEGKKATFLDMYSLLAEECPPGITAHCLRSYCVVLLYQNRADKMLLAAQLAQLANVPLATAKRHLRYLQAVGLLRLAQNPNRWEFAFVPRALSRYYPSGSDRKL